MHNDSLHAGATLHTSGVPFSFGFFIFLWTFLHRQCEFPAGAAEKTQILFLMTLFCLAIAFSPSTSLPTYLSSYVPTYPTSYLPLYLLTYFYTYVPTNLPPPQKNFTLGLLNPRTVLTQRHHQACCVCGSATSPTWRHDASVKVSVPCAIGSFILMIKHAFLWVAIHRAPSLLW